MGLDPDLLYRLVGERIRSARERRRPKLSQAKLAEKLAVTRASIVNIEAGRQRAPLHLLWKIAEELEIELALLIPSHQDYSTAEVPAVEVDDATKAQIEAMTEGDPRTRRVIMQLVSKGLAPVPPPTT